MNSYLLCFVSVLSCRYVSIACACKLGFHYLAAGAFLETLYLSELVQCDNDLLNHLLMHLAQDATVLCRKQISFIALDLSWQRSAH